MKRIAWITFSWLALLSTGQAASFDCRKAATDIEKLVCDSPKIRVLDVELYEVYQRAQRLSASTNQLRSEQRQWIKTSRNSCSTSDCLAVAYEERIKQLNAGITYDECNDDSGTTLAIGNCEGRKNDESAKTIGDLIKLLSGRLSSAEMVRFNKLQDEWSKNVVCSCDDEVGWGNNPSHSANLVFCWKEGAEKRKSEIREIVAGNQGLDYGRGDPTSCAEIAQKLKADPEQQIYDALHNNDLKAVKLLVNKGVTIPEMRDGETALGIAAQNDNNEMLKYLLERGLNAKDDFKAMPYALRHCNKEAVSLLVEHGMPPTINSYNYDPLKDAAYYGCVDIMKYLVYKGSDIKLSRPLRMAACGCRVESVRFLISAGEDASYEDKTSSTPLMCATGGAASDSERERREDCKSVIKLLLNAGAKPEYKSKGGKSAFDYAHDDEEIISLLRGKQQEK